MLLLEAASAPLSIGFGGTGTLGTATALSLTTAYNVQSTSNFLVVGVCGDVSVDDIGPTGVTYNTVTMTYLTKAPSFSGTRIMYFYYLVNPATGSHNVVITAASSHVIRGVACDYSGVDTVTPIDNSTTATTSTSPLTYPLTTSQSNAWIVALSHSTTAGTAVGGGYAISRTVGSSNNPSIWDSNGPVATGPVSNTMNDGTTMTGIAVSIRHR